MAGDDSIDEFLRPLLQGADDSHNSYGASTDFSDQTTIGFGQLMPSPDVQVDFSDLKDVYNKCQKKTANGSEQRIAESKVNIVVTATGQITQIKVFVQRCSEAAKQKNDSIGPVELNVKLRPDMFPANFSVDLDSVYKTADGQLIYELDKVDVEERNKWQLAVLICFIDNTQQTCYSKPFRLRTKPRSKPSGREHANNTACSLVPVVNFPDDAGHSPLSPNNKRPRLDSNCSSVKVPGIPSVPNSGSPFSVNSPTAGTSSVLQNNEVLTEYLEAQRAAIQNLHVKKMICSQNADIAYHLKLGGPQHRQPQMQEGDIIGFFENPRSGNTEIELLSEENSERCRMAGVISRSAYLYGNSPDTEYEATDTVCVIGIVKVKVAGPVQNGERVYASLEVPGVGVPETQLILRRSGSRPPTLLGQALESKNSGTINDISLVQCFVSIVLGIQSRQVESAIDDLQRTIQQKIEFKAKREKRKRCYGLMWKTAVLLIVSALVIFLLFEILMPGSCLRYWLCRRGSIKNHKMSYFHTVDYQRVTVDGVEFSWRRLKEKLGLKFDKYNGTDAHFYLNLNVCAYGGLINSIYDHIPNAMGPDMFAVNSTCSAVFFHVHDTKWVHYPEAQDIRCVPHYN